jgi:hypothetical protein
MGKKDVTPPIAGLQKNGIPERTIERHLSSLKKMVGL